MLKLDLSRTASDFIAGLQDKQFKQVVSAMLSLLRNPQPQDARPLSGMNGYYRIDSSEYHIVCCVVGDLLRVPLIGKRSGAESYRRMDG